MAVFLHVGNPGFRGTWSSSRKQSKNVGREQKEIFCVGKQHLLAIARSNFIPWYHFDTCRGGLGVALGPHNSLRSGLYPRYKRSAFFSSSTPLPPDHKPLRAALWFTFSHPSRQECRGGCCCCFFKTPLSTSGGNNATLLPKVETSVLWRCPVFWALHGFAELLVAMVRGWVIDWAPLNRKIAQMAVRARKPLASELALIKWAAASLIWTNLYRLSQQHLGQRLI